MSTPRPYYNQAPPVPVGTVGEYVNEYGRFPAKVIWCSPNGLYLRLKLRRGYEIIVWHRYFEPVADAPACTCTPVSAGCEGCKAYSREKYGDSIPWKAEDM